MKMPLVQYANTARVLSLIAGELAKRDRLERSNNLALTLDPSGAYAKIQARVRAGHPQRVRSGREKLGE